VLEHALRDKLSVARSEQRRLEFMIEEAESKNLLDCYERDCAEKVEEAGNKIMHNIPNLRSTSEEVLNSTRIILNKLYGDTAPLTRPIEQSR